MQAVEMFHPIQDAERASKKPKNARSFVGDGTPYLRVPKLKKVVSVRIGAAPIPFSVVETVPVDATMRQQEQEVAILKLDKLDDGTPVLLRSVKSNDGIWQKGEIVWVEGEWADDPAAPTAKQDAPESSGARKAELMKLSKEVLLETAKNAKLEFTEDNNKSELADKIIAAEEAAAKS